MKTREIKTREMKVELWDISRLKPYPNNPRENESAVEPVARSIEEFGFQQPIVVDQEGTIIVGHTRVKAAKKLKLKKVPVVIADNLTPEQVKAYRLADNKTNELAQWNMEELKLELDNLKMNFAVDMADFGFFNQEEGEKKNESSKQIYIPDLYQVVIECDDEEDQKTLYEELVQSGRKCRLLNT